MCHYIVMICFSVCQVIANIAQPTHSWQSYDYNPRTKTGTISKYLGMTTEDPVCCSRNELGSLQACPCRQLAQFSLLQTCGKILQLCRLNTLLLLLLQDPGTCLLWRSAGSMWGTPPSPCSFSWGTGLLFKRGIVSEYIVPNTNGT